MITAIIIDDEKHCVNTLAQQIKRVAGDTIRLLPGADNIADGKELIESMKPELVFLDVRIGSATGFELLKQLPDKSFDVIFTTAYDTYAVQAFKFSAIDYLLKPVDPDELKQALDKLQQKSSKDEMSRRYETLLANVSNPQKRLSIPNMNEFEFVEVRDILYCEGSNNYTYFHLKDKSKITSTKTLKSYEEWLEEYGFFRIHKSYLINLAFVKNYHKEGFVTLAGGAKLEVSTRHKPEFIERMTKRK